MPDAGIARSMSSEVGASSGSDSYIESDATYETDSYTGSESYSTESDTSSSSSRKRKSSVFSNSGRNDIMCSRGQMRRISNTRNLINSQPLNSLCDVTHSTVNK